MKAIIYHTNVERSMYSAQLASGSFTVFELIDQVQLSSYTEVSGELERYGENEIQTGLGEKLHIHIDNFDLNEMGAYSKTFLKIS